LLAGEPIHDAPARIYDIAANAGWVSVGFDHDTAAFAVNAIRRWYEAVGRARYTNADRLLIAAARRATSADIAQLRASLDAQRQTTSAASLFHDPVPAPAGGPVRGSVRS
jgi:hypothetical protein